MRGEGWKKELTIKRIVVKSGSIVCQEWDFFADNHPCSVRDGGNSGPKCGKDHAWLKAYNGKLFWCCFRHRISNGPISFDVGHKAKEYIVTAEQAVKICKDFGYKPPKEVMEAFNVERSTNIGRKRRPQE